MTTDVRLLRSTTANRRRVVAMARDAMPDLSVARMLTVEEAARALGVGRTLAYELVRTGQWPTPVVRAGRLIRIPSGPLLALIETGRVNDGTHAA